MAARDKHREKRHCVGPPGQARTADETTRCLVDEDDEATPSAEGTVTEDVGDSVAEFEVGGIRVEADVLRDRHQKIAHSNPIFSMNASSAIVFASLRNLRFPRTGFRRTSPSIGSS
jgi:hypothetical protein